MKLNIGTKIIGGYFLALIILVIIGLISYINTSRLIKDAEWVTHTNLVKYEISQVLSSLKDAETGQRGFLITGVESYLKPFNTGKDSVYIRLKRLQHMIIDNQNQTGRADKLNSLIESKFVEMEETLQLRRSKGFSAAEELVKTDAGKKIMDEIRAILAEMTNEENSLLVQRSAETNATAQATLSTILYGVPIAILLLALIGSVITLNISRPLRQVTRMAELVANGELLGNIVSTTRSDEVGVLIRSFNNMTKYLRDMAETAEQIATGNLTVIAKPKSDKDLLGLSFQTMVEKLRKQLNEIGEGINVLASSSSEIMASVTQLASSSAETATSVGETTTTVEEVKQTAEVSNQKAKAVSENAVRTAEISSEGTKAIANTIEGMNRIRQQMSSIAGMVVKLSEQSQTIGEITASVNELAEQSNLLAVNAAIEAAKAGEQGKGFTVVAQEIKMLADRSREATAQVRNILRDIQKSISSAVMATEEGGKAVDEGLKLTMLSGDTIKSLSESVTEAAKAAIQIAASSQQQLEGMDQMVAAMENIKEASVQAAASTQQSVDSVNELQKVGQKLDEMMKQYKLVKSGN